MTLFFALPFSTLWLIMPTNIDNDQLAGSSWVRAHMTWTLICRNIFHSVRGLIRNLRLWQTLTILQGGIYVVVSDAFVVSAHKLDERDLHL